MRKIDIQITKSKIESFTVSFNEEDEGMEISTTIGLYTARNKKISTYSLSSQSWNENNKIELPMNCITPMLKIAEELEIIATLKCREGQLSLGSGSEEF